MPVKVDLEGNLRALMRAAASTLSVVKWALLSVMGVTHEMPQCLTGSGCLRLIRPVHKNQLYQVPGPLKSCTATCAWMSGTLKALTSSWPISTVAFQPLFPRLPLPSRRMTTSTFDLHTSVGPIGMHISMLHSI